MDDFVSVDVGSGFTQYTDGEKEGVMPSLVAPCPAKLGFGAEEAEVIAIKGKKFLVGKDAEAYMENDDDLYDTLTPDWAGSDAWLALIYKALVDLKRDTGAVDLITGLPQEYYLTQKDKIKEFLQGKHDFLYNNTECSVTIAPYVMPQASGAIFYEGSRNPDIFANDVGVIDVGTFTTGLSVIQAGGRFVPRKSGSYQVGMSNLIARVAQYLRKQHNLHISNAAIPDILLKGRVKNQGQDVDISKDVQDMTFAVAEDLLRGIQNKWIGQGREMLVYIAGGGAPYFYKAISSVIPHATVMEDSFFAVTRGMFAYLYGRKMAA